MSEPVIKVENLSKSYQISHQASAGSAERYTALRDVLSNGVKGMGNRLLGRTASASSATDATREEFWALDDVSFEVKQGRPRGTRSALLGATGRAQGAPGRRCSRF